MAKSPPALISVRFRLLLMQLIKEEGGNVSAAGRRLGLSQPHAKAIVDGTRHAKMETIEKAQQRLPIATRFFVDKELGASPDYRELLETAGKRAFKETLSDEQAEQRAEDEATFREVLAALDKAKATATERDIVIAQLQSGAASRKISIDYVLGVVDTIRLSERMTPARKRSKPVIAKTRRGARKK